VIQGPRIAYDPDVSAVDDVPLKIEILLFYRAVAFPFAENTEDERLMALAKNLDETCGLLRRYSKEPALLLRPLAHPLVKYRRHHQKRDIYGEQYRWRAPMRVKICEKKSASPKERESENPRVGRKLVDKHQFGKRLSSNNEVDDEICKRGNKTQRGDARIV
jgi:hypothetical protein